MEESQNENWEHINKYKNLKTENLKNENRIGISSNYNRNFRSK